MAAVTQFQIKYFSASKKVENLASSSCRCPRSSMVSTNHQSPSRRRWNDASRDAKRTRQSSHSVDTNASRSPEAGAHSAQFSDKREKSAMTYSTSPRTPWRRRSSTDPVLLSGLMMRYWTPPASIDRRRETPAPSPRFGSADRTTVDEAAAAFDGKRRVGMGHRRWPASNRLSLVRTAWITPLFGSPVFAAARA